MTAVVEKMVMSTRQEDDYLHPPTEPEHSEVSEQSEITQSDQPEKSDKPKQIDQPSEQSQSDQPLPNQQLEPQLDQEKSSRSCFSCTTSKSLKNKARQVASGGSGSGSGSGSGTTDYTNISTSGALSKHSLRSSGRLASKASLCYFDTPLQLEVHEKYLTLSGDSYIIREVGTLTRLFMLRSYAYSPSKKKVLYTPDSHIPIYKMSPNILSRPKKMHILDAPSGERAFTLRKSCYVSFHGAAVVKVWAGPRAQGVPYLRIEGDFFDREYKIWKIANGEENIIATVKRKNMFAQNFVLDKETFLVSIEPGNNAALIVMIVVTIAEHWQHR